VRTWQLFKTFTTYVEINGEFNEGYRIVKLYRELEILIVKWTYIFWLQVPFCQTGSQIYLANNILRWLPQIVTTCTWVLGNILKIDSTKKVCRKLQGKSASTASWCSNVNGEVLTSVLTESEGLEGLWPMALGLIQRLISQGICVCSILLSGMKRLGRILHWLLQYWRNSSVCKTL